MGLFQADLLRGPSLLLGMRSSRSPLLIESSVTWRRKLSSVQPRNLPKYLCPAVLSLQQFLGWLKPPKRTRAYEYEAALTCL